MRVRGAQQSIQKEMVTRHVPVKKTGFLGEDLKEFER
jgi:hypothetical protein